MSEQSLTLNTVLIYELKLRLWALQHLQLAQDTRSHYKAWVTWLCRAQSEATFSTFAWGFHSMAAVFPGFIIPLGKCCGGRTHLAYTRSFRTLYALLLSGTCRNASYDASLPGFCHCSISMENGQTVWSRDNNILPDLLRVQQLP
ncbi:hypothetical protein Y032_0690g1564 [Ancylostoma ceylanicum]|uniref:Uncharacterized protein n=1 Tax=Ancylostoma ceylanicum TaxID=53326 RepID=A0A016WGW4_9BILA|nr:hypothetical protein Y032_0690g1564 [Ancylostoma ceylanicum]